MAKKPATKKEPVVKKPSLDIKEEMMYADYKVFDWLSSQTDELAKTFSPIVAMKWLSVTRSTPERNANYIIDTNEMVNHYFWDLAKHPDLQWRLMCAAGGGEPLEHGWVPLATSRRKISKVDQVFLDLYPSLNDEELACLRGKYDAESFKRLLLDMAMPDPDIKKLMEEFKKSNG